MSGVPERQFGNPVDTGLGKVRTKRPDPKRLVYPIKAAFEAVFLVNVMNLFSFYRLNK